MKIAYIPTNDPYDKHSWSGTDYYTRKALEKQGHDVYCIYGFRYKMSAIVWFKKVIARTIGKYYDRYRTFDYSRKYAEFIEQSLLPDTDCIFSMGTLQVACIKTSCPVFIYVDGIFEQMRTYYRWEKQSKGSVREANKLEQAALDNCTSIISCSVETGEYIKKYYRNVGSKLCIVPLGANWDKEPDEAVVKKAIAQRPMDICHILFVGVSWYRKGADIVLETVRMLHDRGLNVVLHICGIRDVPVELPDYVVNHGFLSKEDVKEGQLLSELFMQSHFLFVPSRAEAYGLVFCEASAYGLPSISCRTGGLTTTVIDGINGQLFDLNATVGEYADYISNMFRDHDSYIRLCYTSQERYKCCLNWNAAGKALTKVMQEHV